MSVSPQQESISHYRLIELIGAGAMGEVWLAEDTQLPRKVAIKLLPRNLADSDEAVDRLMREARAAATVDHPGVVTVYEAGIVSGRPYLVMQRAEGETLEARLGRDPLPFAEASAITSQIADALAEVHQLGIVHRDLKPSNIVLTSRGAKILDFGVASLKGATALTRTGAAIGTPRYMSPEQLKGLPPDNRSDLWALGVMFYEMLSGLPPFPGNSFEAVSYAILNAQPAAPSTIRRGLPADLDFIVMKLMRKDPTHRYTRAEDLLGDLANCGCEPPRPAEADAAPGVPRIPRVAVLYFEVMSPNPDDEFIAAGLTEDLIVDLTRLGGVRVAGRAEVLPYRDRLVPPRTLGRELGVDYVVHGSVRRAGTRARITVQMLRSTDGHAMCAERFDRTLDDLFEVQAEVSKRIVQSLELVLKPEEEAMLDRRPTVSPAAYADYLKARNMLDTRGRDGNFLAEELLKAAIAKDPRFALAHATLGECYAQRGLTWISGLGSADLALPHAERALELEPDLLEGHLVRGMVHRMKGDSDALLRDIDRITALDPNHAEAQEWAAWSYLALGKPELARPILERAVITHPNRYMAVSWLSACCQMLGLNDRLPEISQLQRERCIDELRRHPDNVHCRSILAGALLDLGEKEVGVQQVLRAVEMAPADNRVRYNAACVLARAGKLDEAMAHLKHAAEAVPTYIADWPRRDPELKSLHDHPEFVKLFGKV